MPDIPPGQLVDAVFLVLIGVYIYTLVARRKDIPEAERDDSNIFLWAGVAMLIVGRGNGPWHALAQVAALAAGGVVIAHKRYLVGVILAAVGGVQLAANIYFLWFTR